jgi:hypothetical protein
LVKIKNFEVRGGNLKKKIHSGKSGASQSKELILKLVWPKHTNILFIFSLKQAKTLTK